MKATWCNFKLLRLLLSKTEGAVFTVLILIETPGLRCPVFAARAASRAVYLGNDNPDWVKMFPKREQQNFWHRIRCGALRF